MNELEIPDKVRKYVLDRDGHYCQNDKCINKYGKYNSLTLDHIVARSALGSGRNPCNLITVCWPCHDKKQLLINNIPGWNVTEESNLLHREQVKFYDHDYPEGAIPCSHNINQKKGSSMENDEDRKDAGSADSSSEDSGSGQTSDSE